MPPTIILSHPGFYVCILHILQETAQPSVCDPQVRGSILRNFCCLVAYLCRVVSLRTSLVATGPVVSLSRYVSSPVVRLVAPPRPSEGPAWSSLAQDPHVSCHR